MNDLSAYNHLFVSWKQRNLSVEEIFEELKLKIEDETHIHEIISAYKKKLDSHRVQNGFILTGIGSLLCLISCLTTIFLNIPEWRDFLLIGLTTIGVLVIMVGFYMIFEK